MHAAAGHAPPPGPAGLPLEDSFCFPNRARQTRLQVAPDGGLSIDWERTPNAKAPSGI